MNKYYVAIVAAGLIAVAVQVLAKPQIKVEVNVKGVTEPAWVTNVLNSAGDVLEPIIGTTPRPTLPQRIQQTVQGALQSITSQIQNAPTNIQNAIRNATSAIRNIFGPRTTTAAPFVLPSLSINLNNNN